MEKRNFSWKIFAFFICVLVSGCICASFERKIVADHFDRLGWKSESHVHSNSIIQFTIYLKNQNVKELKRIFEEVSDPSHPNYGKHKSMQELNKLTNPSQKSWKKVENWLKELKDEENTKIQRKSSHFTVSTSASAAEKFFQTRFKTWTHLSSGSSVVRTFGYASIPKHMEEHVELVSGLSEFHFPKKHSKRTIDPKVHRKDYYLGFNSTVKSLREFYNIVDVSTQSNKTSQAVLAFNDFFSMDALKQFLKFNNISTSEPIVIGRNCLSDVPPCDEGESDLDIQYMMGLAPGVRTYFVGNDNSSWVLEALSTILPTLPEQPQVISISYGSSELHNCDPPSPPKSCTNTQISNSKYIELTDIWFMKLGASGTTVLISSGDDGSNGTPWESASCPLDNSVYAPDGAQFNSSECMQTLLNFNGTDYVFPMSYAVSSNLPDSVANRFFSDNSGCDVQIDNATFSLHTNCSCDKLNYKSYQANSTTFVFKKFRYSDSLGRTYAQSWPATSPYITSVGATTIWGPKNESAASSKVGAVISSGGGFSNYYSIPAYQRKAIALWNLQQNQGDKRVGGNYSIEYRGYPDISLSGHNYLTFGANHTMGHVDGTSASSPSFGAIVSLLNDARLSRGQRPMGFLNYLLYSKFAAINGTYFDTTQGETKCGEKNCCKFGFVATKGWDPTTGFGTPNYKKWKELILSPSKRQ